MVNESAQSDPVCELTIISLNISEFDILDLGVLQERAHTDACTAVTGNVFH